MADEAPKTIVMPHMQAQNFISAHVDSCIVAGPFTDSNKFFLLFSSDAVQIAQQTATQNARGEYETSKTVHVQSVREDVARISMSYETLKKIREAIDTQLNNSKMEK